MERSGEPERQSASVRSGEGSFPPPPRQRPYDIAIRVAYETLRERELTADRLSRLGALLCDDGIRLPALDQQLVVKLDREEVLVDGGGHARYDWTLLALHYLSAVDLSEDNREVTLSHFADARGYLAVYNKRIIGRFLATVGATDEGFRQRAEQLHATAVPWNGTCFRFTIFPRVPLTIVRYEGDEEYPPGANIIYRADAEHLLPAEDRIVAAETLINTLSGVPLHI